MTRRSLLLASAASLAAQDAQLSLTLGVASTLVRPPAARETFLLTAAAGQSLLVENNVENYMESSGDDRITVFPPGGGKPFNSTLGDDERCLIWLNVLPQRGTWKVTLDSPRKVRHVLRFTLLDPHDPRLDAGVRPSQISIRGLPGLTWKQEPFSPPIPQLADYGPARLIGAAGPWSIEVMTAEGFAQTFWTKRDAQRLSKLQAALSARAWDASPYEFPHGAASHAELLFRTTPRYLEGPGIRAMRWLGTYYQTDDAPVDPITYAAEALTSDGRHLVILRSRISHPAIPKSFSNLHGAALERFHATLRRQLDAAPLASFHPNLGDFDRIVTSFAIRHG